MKYLIVLILFVNCSWFNLRGGYNTQSATELARYQTDVLKNWNNNMPISKQTLDSLENNLWIKTCEQICPSNLVIRQWCLIDLIKDSPSHSIKIHEMIEALSGRTYPLQIHYEGYSYWLYTKECLDPWMDKFGHQSIKMQMEFIDNSFVQTAYKRGELYYPAPYGDLADAPLAPYLQPLCHDVDTVYTSMVSMKHTWDGYSYVIFGNPIGLNIHIPKDTVWITVRNGVPEGFKFYTSIKNKYPSDEAYWLDILDPKRVQSIEKYNTDIENIGKIIVQFKEHSIR